MVHRTEPEEAAGHQPSMWVADFDMSFAAGAGACLSGSIEKYSKCIGIG
jgi:hypothetical protein